MGSNRLLLAVYAFILLALSSLVYSLDFPPSAPLERLQVEQTHAGPTIRGLFENRVRPPLGPPPPNCVHGHCFDGYPLWGSVLKRQRPKPYNAPIIPVVTGQSLLRIQTHNPAFAIALSMLHPHVSAAHIMATAPDRSTWYAQAILVNNFRGSCGWLFLRSAQRGN
jgi:hypothetical protein